MGYHVSDIPRGEYGEISKIVEEGCSSCKTLRSKAQS